MKETLKTRLSVIGMHLIALFVGLGCMAIYAGIVYLLHDAYTFVLLGIGTIALFVAYIFGLAVCAIVSDFFDKGE